MIDAWHEGTPGAPLLDRLTDELLTKLRAIGPERVTVIAQMVKLQDEVDEVVDAIQLNQLHDGPALAVLKELADVVIVCNTAARVLGYSTNALGLAVLRKSARNAQRDWYPTASGTARHTPEEDQK